MSELAPKTKVVVPLKAVVLAVGTLVSSVFGAAVHQLRHLGHQVAVIDRRLDYAGVPHLPSDVERDVDEEEASASRPAFPFLARK
jgi:hypothetical protein